MTTDKEKIQELTAHNDELENYFRNTIIPQLYVDAELKLRKFTPPAMKQFDLKLTDTGKHIDDVKDNFRFPTLIDNIQHVIEHNEILEKEIQTTDFRWYQMNIIPYVKLPHNTNNGVIITFVEITSRIKDLKEQERLNADHEILLDTLSHDIKNPLSNLVLAIDQFRNTKTGDEKEFNTLLGIVERALHKMQTLIIDLTATRKDDHKYKTIPELLNVEHILEDVRLLLNEDIQTAGAVIKTQIEASEIFFVRRKLRTILYNLINNSIKYKDPTRTPSILISSDKKEGLVISIQDNGVGIEEEKQEKIFSKYYRIDNSIEGTGIGLYLVKEIVNHAGGRIEVSSTHGEGTLISVFLRDEVG